MARYSDEDYGGYSGDHGQYSLEQTKNNSINLLSSLSSVQIKDGKNYYMGIEVAPELAGALQYLTSTYPTYLSDFVREGVYDNSEYLFNKLNKQFGITKNPAAGTKAGLYTSAAVSGLLIGLQPIVEIIRSVNQSRKDKKQIKEVLSAVIETNKDSYKDNEVIQTIMDNTHKAMVTGFKRAAAELPTVLANGYYANLSHKALVKEKTHQNAIKNSVNGDDHLSQLQQDAIKEEDRERNYKKMLADNPDSEAVQRLIARDKAKYENLAREDYYKEPDQNSDEKNRLLHVNLAAGANIFLKNMASRGSDDATKMPTAYDLIIDLQKKINNGEISQGSNIKEQIIEIFQQNERDRNRPPMGEALLEKFSPLAERIGEVISNRELDAISLVSLVGDKKVVSVNRHFIATEKLEALIDKQRAIFSNHENTPIDEMLGDFKNPKLVMKAIKDGIATLKGDERARYASMFSDQVLIEAGVPKKEILQIRMRGHDSLCEFTKTRTIELAKKTNEELKEQQQFSNSEVEGIRKLNDLIIAGDDKAIKATIGSDKSVISAVRKSTINDQMNERKREINKWAEVEGIKKASQKPKSSTATERVSASRENPTALGV